MLNKIFRTFLLLLISNFFILNFCFSFNIKDKDLNNHVMFFVAKKEFKLRNYIFSDCLFSSIIKSNHPSNKYTQKSRIYSALIRIKLNKIKSARRIGKSLLYNKAFLEKKYLNYVYFLNAFILYKLFEKQFSININIYKCDQSRNKKALRWLNKIKEIKNKIFVDLAISKIDLEMKKNTIYIADYYFRKKAYLAVIKRVHHFNYDCKDKYDFYKNYLLIRSYNELFLSDISNNMLNFKKK